MYIKRFLVLALLLYTVLMADTKKSERMVIASVGNKKITQEDYEAFNSMLKYYPVKLENRLFPGQRSHKTLCIESYAFSKKAGKEYIEELEQDLDFQWKKKYYPAQLYLRSILDRNLGSTEEEISTYYKKNKEEFRRTKEMEDGEDSTWIASKSAVKKGICEKLFIKKYPPDEEFYKRFTGKSDKDSGSVDTASAHRNWIRKTRARLPDFFMEKFYKEYTGESMPDSTDQLLAKGGIIDSADLKVIESWLPSKKKVENDSVSEKKKKFLCDWLVKWELFSRKAEESGFMKEERHKSIADWAENYEIAISYVNNKLIPEVKEYQPEIDTQMCIYDLWDEVRNIKPYNPEKLNSIIKRAKHKFQIMEFERRVAEIRDGIGVEFYYDKYQDENHGDPEKLLAAADSIVETEDSEKAKEMYRRLKRYFGYTDAGKEAYKGLAKFYKSTDLYLTSIGVYRNYLILNREAKDRDNIFFMIGFMFDEHMNASNLAFAQYRWIMKNHPDSDLIDDVEFMAHHIDEPMPSVEELQGEAKRQGKDKI